MICAAELAAMMTTPAHAMLCGQVEKMFTLIQSTHKETPVAGGRSAKVGSVVLVMSPAGGWSLLKIYTASRACVVDSGRGWYFYKGAPPKVYKLNEAPS